MFEVKNNPKAMRRYGFMFGVCDCLSRGLVYYLLEDLDFINAIDIKLDRHELIDKHYVIEALKVIYDKNMSLGRDNAPSRFGERNYRKAIRLLSESVQIETENMNVNKSEGGDIVSQLKPN